MKRTFLTMIIGTVAALAWMGLPAERAVAATQHGTCQNVSVPVAVAPGLPANEQVSGTLCTPDDPAPGNSKIDLLVHGGTYNRSYWDLPFDHPQYSYADRALQQGRATLAYDRLGVGASSRPLSAIATLNADAYVLHQLIGWLRNEKSYQEVTVIGHSLGSAVAISETAAHNDADRIVLTGLLHTTKLSILPLTTTAFYPAMLDPQFFGTILDPGYLTTVPGIRGDVFYSSSADPGVISYDESHKDIMNSSQLAATLALVGTPALLNISRQIELPVMLQVGSEDVLFCGGSLGVDCSSGSAVAAHEAPFYTNAASLSASTIDGTGHNLTLHPSAGQSFDEINSWIESH